jgi:hypothetical protein
VSLRLAWAKWQDPDSKNKNNNKKNPTKKPNNKNKKGSRYAQRQSVAMKSNT